MRPLYVVGDIHGCLVQLSELIEKIKEDISEPSTICFIGDMIDRGPDSFGVVECLKYLKIPDVELVFLRGNHEQTMLDTLDQNFEYTKPNPIWAKNGGIKTVESYIEAGRDFICHHQFYNDLKYSYRHYDEFGNSITCVHAGLDPNLILEDQTKESLLLTRKFTEYNGEYLDTDMVVFGHTVNRELIIRNHHVGIDTGCGFGGKLSCVKFIETGKISKLLVVNNKSASRRFWFIVQVFFLPALKITHNIFQSNSGA